MNNYRFQYNFIVLNKQGLYMHEEKGRKEDMKYNEITEDP